MTNNKEKGFLSLILPVIASVIIIYFGVFILLQQQKPDVTSTPSNSITNNEADKAATPETKQYSNSESMPNVFVIQDDGTLTDQAGRLIPLAVARKFYSLNSDKNDYYDFLTLFTAFRVPNYIENHMGLRNNVKGAGGIPTFSAVDLSNLPSKLVGINNMYDVYSPIYNKSENDVKNNLYLMNHETGHQWLA